MKKEKSIKGFKAYDKGLICQGFQFAENSEFEIKGNPKLCERGFHFCENPLDVLNYYDLCDSEFTSVESSGDTETDNIKTVTNKIKIGIKLDLKAFIKASIDFFWEKCSTGKGENIQAASGDSSKLAASGYSSQLAASGYSSQLAASGYYSKLAASGDSSQLAASGYYSKLAASGYYSQLAASGDYSKLAASGDSSQLAASGDSSQLAASGDYSKLAASGDYSKLAASGYSSQLAASGYSSQLALDGNNSVGAAIGVDCKIKGKLGCWITLAEWENNIPVCVKSAKIDGKKLKPDTWYSLKNGKFVKDGNN